jgi:hypothetical protein
MPAYADTSFLARVDTPHADSTPWFDARQAALAKAAGLKVKP